LSFPKVTRCWPSIGGEMPRKIQENQPGGLVCCNGLFSRTLIRGSRKTILFSLRSLGKFGKKPCWQKNLAGSSGREVQNPARGLSRRKEWPEPGGKENYSGQKGNRGTGSHTTNLVPVSGKKKKILDQKGGESRKKTPQGTTNSSTRTSERAPGEL